MRIVIINGKAMSWMDVSRLFTKHINAHVDPIQLVLTENYRPSVR